MGRLMHIDNRYGTGRDGEPVPDVSAETLCERDRAGPGAVDCQVARYTHEDTSGIGGTRGAGVHRDIGTNRQRTRLAAGYVDRYDSGAPGAERRARNLTGIGNRKAFRGDR